MSERLILAVLLLRSLARSSQPLPSLARPDLHCPIQLAADDIPYLAVGPRAGSDEPRTSAPYEARPLHCVLRLPPRVFDLDLRDVPSTMFAISVTMAVAVRRGFHPPRLQRRTDAQLPAFPKVELLSGVCRHGMDIV